MFVFLSSICILIIILLFSYSSDTNIINNDPKQEFNEISKIRKQKIQSDLNAKIREFKKLKLDYYTLEEYGYYCIKKDVNENKTLNSMSIKGTPYHAIDDSLHKASILENGTNIFYVDSTTQFVIVNGQKIFYNCQIVDSAKF
jgi:hypothetical protein